MKLNQQVNKTAKNLVLFTGIISFLPGCIVVQPPRQPITIDGSSTVYPITELVTKEFNAQNEDSVEVEVDFSGTIGGFEKFCTGKTAINNASIPIPQEAMAKCKSNGVAYIELPVAFDAITVVINQDNDWAETMTVEELKNLWQPSAQGNITQWNQVNPNWKPVTINLFGPGEDSGTFDYFTTVIVGQEGASRKDYVATENDETIVKGVSQDINAIGYFGYSYYEENTNQLKAVAIDNGNGPVSPSEETVKNHSYQPLARPLFIYVNAKKAQENPALSEFVEFYLDQAPQIVAQVGYIPLPDSAYHSANIHFEQHQVGTVFGGKPIVNVTINELLNRSYAQEGKEGYVY